jgi:RpiB/LacA/LacB family sugar-phosphate isomerase
MKVAFACDHGGFPLKEVALETIREVGDEPIDLGTFSPVMDDYPDITEKAGRAIQEGKAERAVVICGSGVGASVAANKMNGVYAAICHDTYSAHQGVEHDNMNVLCLGARIVGPELAKELIRAFLSARFINDGRYLRRFEKIQKMEKGESLS